MRYLEAYKDSSGFHYLVELKGPGGQVQQKTFNYAAAPGFIYADLAVSMEENPAGTKTITVPETEDDYQKRIEEEIEAVSKQLETAWQIDATTGAITADIKSDLLKKKSSTRR